MELSGLIALHAAARPTSEEAPPSSPPLDASCRPEQFKGKHNQLLSPFFNSIAREVGSAEGAEDVLNIKNNLKSKFWRTRIGQMFGLTPEQFYEAGATHGMLLAVKEFAGGKFARPPQPLLRPARLVAGVGGDGGTDDGGAEGGASDDEVVKEEDDGEGDQSREGENTLAAELGQKKLKSIIVPKAVLEAARNITDCTAAESNRLDISASCRAVPLMLLAFNLPQVSTWTLAGSISYRSVQNTMLGSSASGAS